MGSLVTQTLPAVPGGMNVAQPAQEIQDTEARYLQDVLVDIPGKARRRGPVAGVTSLAALSRKGTGLLLTLDPGGLDRYAVLNGDAVNGYFSVYSADFTSLTDLTWPHPLPTNVPTNPYRIVDAKSAILGGLMVGVSSSYDAVSPNQGIAFWKGGIKANYTTGTITVTRGSAAVTGAGTAWNANATAGMWLFASTDEGYTSTLIGCVQEVNSDGSLTLDRVSPYAITAKAYTLQSLRGFAPKVVTGEITCDTSSTTVNGGLTKFSSQGLGSGTWQLYRQRDLAYIGKVSSVASDTSLTLTANAAIACADEQYVALQADADWNIENTASAQKVGFLNANYSQRQWYANNGAQQSKTVRLWFSDPYDPEAVDLSNDGDWLEIDSTGAIQEPIRAIVSTYNALLVLKDTEAFGVFGASPSQFSVRKLEDDGTLCGMSVQQYGGGAIWAGRDGIYFFDGVQIQNMAEGKLGNVWKNSILTFDPATYRMWSMVARNHYILHIENLQPTISVTKGTTSVTPTRWTVVINMVTQAFSIFTNVNLRGSIRLPAEAGARVWYLVNDGTKGVICDSSFIFDLEGVDAVACDGGTAGPDFFWETKKFDVGDALLLKRFKQIAAHYLVQGGDITVDAVLGLNNIGEVLSSTLPNSVYTWTALKNAFVNWNSVKATFADWNDVISSVFVPKRIRFLKTSQHLAFRFYQSNNAISRLQIGPYQIGFKPMRAGRV